MEIRIVWSPESEDDFSNILNYLILKWSLKISNNFIEDINNSIDKISKNPLSYSVSYEPEQIRSCFVSKHNTIHYNLFKDKILILRVFDTRQNPNKLIFPK